MMREDWIEVELGDVCFTTSGGTPSRSKSEYYKGTIPWVKSGELNYNIIFDTEEHISDEAVQKSSAKIFPEGTLLIALYGATIGKLAVLGVPATTNQAICGIYKNKLFETKFLFNYLFHKRQKLIEQGTGGAQPNISQTILKKLPLPLAPVPEQRAIAAKIEQLFSELDNGIANLKAAKSKLEIYRQSVFKKMLDGIELVSFEEIIKSSQNGISKRQGISGKETKVLRLADISDLQINYESPRYILLDDTEIKKYKISKNDLLVIRVNGSKDLVGRLISFTQKDELETWTFCDHFIRLSLDPDKFNSKFYFYFFQMPETRKYIHDNMVSSAGQNTVSQVTIKSVKVPYLDKTSQNKIVQEIETRLSVCDKLKESIDQSLEKAQALRQSILKKAFEGKLLSQDELQTCRQQPDWEPAAKLLERVKNKKSK